MRLSDVNTKIKEELIKERCISVDYREHLNRLLELCVDCIRNLSASSFEDELPNGTNHNDLNEDVSSSVKTLLAAYDSYSAGKISSAITIMKDRFLAENTFQIFSMRHGQKWYRARKADNSGRGFSAKDMFHVPFDKRTEVANCRFSISGYPCLYLGSTLLSCWEEMHCPSLHELVVSKVAIKTESTLDVLDLRIPEASSTIPLFEGLTDEEMRYKNLLMLKTWPLIVACSIKTISPNAPFKFEYIHPQLLMLAMKELGRERLYGIAYTSTHLDVNMTADISCYTNVAIPVRNVKSKGYCEHLSQLFDITRGVSFMEAEIKNVFDMLSTLHLDPEKGTLSVVSYNDGTAPYENTKFGQIENFLNDGVQLESLID